MFPPSTSFNQYFFHSSSLTGVYCLLHLIDPPPPHLPSPAVTHTLYLGLPWQGELHDSKNSMFFSSDVRWQMQNASSWTAKQRTTHLLWDFYKSLSRFPLSLIFLSIYPPFGRENLPVCSSLYHRSWALTNTPPSAYIF